MTVLTPETLEAWRTAAEYLPWVRNLIAQVKMESDGMEQIRFRRGLAKELMCEALPIGLLAECYFGASEQVRIKLKIGNQSFDAFVEDKRVAGSGVEHIEVTVAGDGEEDYLRMFVLHERGHVSGLGRVTKTGTQKRGLKVTVADEMSSQREVLNQERERVTRAVERKLGKNYPANTLLLLAFDDVMSFDRADNLACLEAVLANFLPKLQRFHSVTLVGSQKGTFICRRTSDAI